TQRRAVEPRDIPARARDGNGAIARVLERGFVARRAGPDALGDAPPHAAGFADMRLAVGLRARRARDRRVDPADVGAESAAREVSALDYLVTVAARIRAAWIARSDPACRGLPLGFEAGHPHVGAVDPGARARGVVAAFDEPVARAPAIDVSLLADGCAG